MTAHGLLPTACPSIRRGCVPGAAGADARRRIASSSSRLALAVQVPCARPLLILGQISRLRLGRFGRSRCNGLLQGSKLGRRPPRLIQRSDLRCVQICPESVRVFGWSTRPLAGESAAHDRKHLSMPESHSWPLESDWRDSQSTPDAKFFRTADEDPGSISGSTASGHST